jgi:hypothetical protein
LEKVDRLIGREEQGFLQVLQKQISSREEEERIPLDRSVSTLLLSTAIHPPNPNFTQIYVEAFLKKKKPIIFFPISRLRGKK